MADKIIKLDGAQADIVDAIGLKQGELQQQLIKVSQQLNAMAKLLMVAAGDKAPINDKRQPRFEKREDGVVLVIPEVVDEQRE